MSGKRMLVNEQEALGLYLESLLRDVPEATPEPEKKSAPTAEPALEVRAEVQMSPAAVPIPSVAPASPDAQVEPPAPGWAAHRFECLMFKVCGVTLAVPLAELGGILKWGDEKVTPMPGHSPWFLGLLEHQGQKVKIIDTALLVVPKVHRDKHPTEPDQRLQRIVLIGEGRWGLACDDVAQVVAIEPSAVHWRTSRTQRRWLLGTVVEYMCALLDAREFAAMLGSGEAQAAN